MCIEALHEKNWTLRFLISLVRKTPGLQGCVVHEIQFFLREERKHDMLKLSQFRLETSAGMVESVVYTENGSRNWSGSYKGRSEAKQVKHFVNKSLGTRCSVYLLKLYYSKLPDVESDLQLFMYPPHVQLTTCWTFHILVWLLYQLLWFRCFVTNIFQYWWNIKQGNSACKYRILVKFLSIGNFISSFAFQVWRNMTFILCLNNTFLKISYAPDIHRAWLFPCPGNVLVSIIKKVMKCLMKH